MSIENIAFTHSLNSVLAHHCPPGSVDLVKTAAVLDDMQTRDDNDARKYALACIGIAKTAFEQDESAPAATRTGYHYFAELEKKASANDWNPVYQAMAVRPVHRALGALCSDETVKKEAELLKSGSAGVSELLNSIVGAGSAGVGAGRDILKLLYGAAVLGGGGLGTLAWHLNRDASYDTKDEEAAKVKADNLRRLTMEIERNIHERP